MDDKVMRNNKDVWERIIWQFYVRFHTTAKKSSEILAMR
jgi:hypothetical protein